MGYYVVVLNNMLTTFHATDYCAQIPFFASLILYSEKSLSLRKLGGESMNTGMKPIGEWNNVWYFHLINKYYVQRYVQPGYVLQLIQKNNGQ